jgi:phosphohistidine phosphatase
MASKPTRRLALLRHAKSAWPDLPDHDRPLAGRGRGDAPAIGRWLRETGCIPDLVWCSTAERATQTWQLAAAELGADPPVSYEPRMYGATGGELADLIRRAPARTKTLLLVGHNPGIQDLALTLSAARDAGPPGHTDARTAGSADGDAGAGSADGHAGATGATGRADAGPAGDADAAEALDRAAIKFPTAALAVLEFNGDWPDLSAGRARLVSFVVPRELRG